MIIYKNFDHYLKGEWKKTESTIKKEEIKLIGVSENLVDLVWKEDCKAEMLFSEISVHSMKYAGFRYWNLIKIKLGESWEDKIKKTRKELEKNNVTALFISSLDSIACI